MTAQTITLDGPVTHESTVPDGRTYTVRDGGTVELAGRTFTVQIHALEGGSEDVHLIGPRGARYLLRPYLGPDNGKRQIISLGSGAPLRYRGNTVQAFVVGDLITAEYRR